MATETSTNKHEIEKCFDSPHYKLIAFKRLRYCSIANTINSLLL